jgi:hypothetical protein
MAVEVVNAPAAWRDCWKARGPAGAALALAAATTLLHLATAGGYGIFRDELYYLANAQHLDWGYVDHPPLVALLAWLVRHTLGTSLLALRAVPAIAAGVVVLLTTLLVRQLGGGRWAPVLAGAAVALAPVYLSLFTILSMNAVDLVVWAGLALVLARILATGDGRLWLVFGAVAGVGLQNKVSVLFFGFGAAVGLVAAREWAHLRDRRLWLGGGLAALLFAPHVIWQVAQGWPTIEFMIRAATFKNVALGPLAFVGEQVMMLNPVAAPLWVGGLGYLLAGRSMRPFRALGFAYLAVLLVMLTQNAKSYYLAPIYPVLFAAGAVLVERASRGSRLAWLTPASVAAILASGLAFAPLAKPLLPVEAYVSYASALGVGPSSSERHHLGRLPQFFADMHGWRELAEAVAEVHRALPPEERAAACVFGQNYGQAGAIDFFGPSLGLPPAISGHNSYWLWGPRGCDGRVLIIIGGDPGDHREVFASVTPAGRFQCRDCMPYESDQVLWVGRGLTRPLAEVWPGVKHFN